MALTSTQKKQYAQEGFLVLPDFIPSGECDRLIEEAETLVSRFEPDESPTVFSTQDQKRVSNEYFLGSGDQIRFFFEPNAFSETGKLQQEKRLSINKMGHALHDLNPVFDRFSRRPELASICSDLEIAKPLLIQSMYLFKQPRIGGEVTCHQDGTFLYTNPLNIVGFWFALQDATLANGCLFALKGGHLQGLKRRFRLDGKGGVTFDEFDQTPWPNEGYVPLEAKKGTLVLLHGLLPHFSGPNKSDQARHAYTLHVIDGAAEYPKDNWLRRAPDHPAHGFSEGRSTALPR